ISIRRFKTLLSNIKPRNLSIFILMVALPLAFLWQPEATGAETIDTKAETAIIVDADTGKVLYEKDADEALPPASMTKMMTAYLVLEQIDDGELNWDTTTEISDYAYNLSGNNDFSGVGLHQDVDYTVEELYEAMVIDSNNA